MRSVSQFVKQNKTVMDTGSIKWFWSTVKAAAALAAIPPSWWPMLLSSTNRRPYIRLTDLCHVVTPTSLATPTAIPLTLLCASAALLLSPSASSRPNTATCLSCTPP